MTRKRWYLFMNSLVALWLLATGVIVIAHRFVPVGMWLMVHLLLLGALSTAILIWSQHFTDTLTRRPPPGGRAFHGVRLIAHTVGAAIVVAGMMTAAWPLVHTGGAIVGLVAIAHAVALALQLRGALPARFAPLVRFYVAAGASLVLGVAIGVIMARADLAAAVHERLYIAHLGFNLLGWVGLTVVGTLVLLWPTVLHTQVSPSADAKARRALLLMIAGLVLLGASSLFDVRVGIALAGLLYVAGVVLVFVQGVAQARRAAPVTFAGWSIAAAAAWFLACTVAFGAVIVTAADWADAGERVGWLVGPFAAGFAAQILLGALSYLLPVVLGGGPEVSRRTARELDRAAVFRVLVVNAGIAVYLLPVSSFVKVVVSLVVFGVLATFLVLAVRAVFATRAKADRPAKSAPARPTSAAGSVTAAAAALILAVTAGVALDPASAGLRMDQGAPSVQATGNTTIVEMSMKDMRFTPDVVEVPVGDRLVIELTNADDQVHDLVLATGVKSGRLGPGATATVDVGVVGADIEGWCSVAGHRLMGMVMSVVAVGAEPGSQHPDAAGHDHGAASGESAAKHIDLMAEPDGPFEARDAALPPAASATVHRHTFTVQEVEREVAPGVTQALWTFNGTAPGPTLRGKVGDVFDITLVNDGTIGHSIDFHAGALAPDRPMRTLAPGESLNYRFTATRSGIWLYHCATMPMSLHIANGMFGAVIIDPTGLEQVDREYLMVQSEYYLGPQGEPADAARLATQSPDLVAFNGYANQYQHDPLTARVGERVRVWVLDAGPNRPSSFHIVGGQFDTVFSEGEYLLRDGGSTGTGGSQALALQPAQGGFVELVFPEAGNYPVVSHIMSDAEKGASGVFRVTD